MHDHISRVKANVSKVIKVPLSQHEQDAVTSLVYNIGITQFRSSKALKLLNAGDKEGFIREAFDAKDGFVRQDGKILTALVDRRSKERELFTS